MQQNQNQPSPVRVTFRALWASCWWLLGILIGLSSHLLGLWLMEELLWYSFFVDRFKTALNEHCLVVIAYYWFSRDVTAATLTYKTLGQRSFGNTGIKSSVLPVGNSALLDRTWAPTVECQPYRVVFPHLLVSFYVNILNLVPNNTNIHVKKWRHDCHSRLGAYFLSHNALCAQQRKLELLMPVIDSIIMQNLGNFTIALYTNMAVLSREWKPRIPNVTLTADCPCINYKQLHMHANNTCTRTLNIEFKTLTRR